ncbi:MAG: hypothetical protein ACK5W0_16280 [Labrys sp. (in: a-proteobacteria)]
MTEWLNKDTAAIIGAFTGTISLFWNALRDFLNWRKNRPNLVVRASVGKDENSEECIFVEISNQGVGKTTVSHISILRWKNKIHRLFNYRKAVDFNPKISGVSLDGHYIYDQAKPDAFLIDTGSHRIFMLKTKSIAPLTGYVYVTVAHSMSKARLFVKVLTFKNPSISIHL